MKTTCSGRGRIEQVGRLSFNSSQIKSLKNMVVNHSSCPTKMVTQHKWLFEEVPVQSHTEPMSSHCYMKYHCLQFTLTFYGNPTSYVLVNNLASNNWKPSFFTFKLIEKEKQTIKDFAVKKGFLSFYSVCMFVYVCICVFVCLFVCCRSTDVIV